MPRIDPHMFALLRYNQKLRWFQRGAGVDVDRNDQEALVDVRTFRVGYENQVIKENGFRRNIPRLVKRGETPVNFSDLPEVECGRGWMEAIVVRGFFNDDGTQAGFEISASTRGYVAAVQGLLNEVESQRAAYGRDRFPVVVLGSTEHPNTLPQWVPALKVLRWVDFD